MYWLEFEFVESCNWCGRGWLQQQQLLLWLLFWVLCRLLFLPNDSTVDGGYGFCGFDWLDAEVMRLFAAGEESLRCISKYWV